MKKGIHFLLVVLFIPVLAFSQQKKPVVATDLMKIATTSQIQISPDGTRAIITVVRKVVKNENDYFYSRNLHLLDLVGKSEPTQLTFGDKNDNQPQWSQLYQKSLSVFPT